LLSEDLRILVKSEIINGNYIVAAKYAAMLSRTFAYRKEAKEYLGLLAAIHLLSTSSETGC
jgi:hypothetical protein